ncbi:unnamed protein product [Effrenium voratum]|uniref:Protein kinase domain-containing protein n=1 Tax=Effrenium voratum TaxID=2562239 RepID=A0AA36JIV5_9DINO|nr:unnamed protein product [Effrenium voratum]
MFAKAERWRKPQPSGPGPGAYEAPYGAGFTFGRRWTRDTCRQRHQRQRRVAAPAALPGPTLLVARSPTPYMETVIGKGGLAQVILGRFGGRKVAVKVVSDEKNEELRKEFEILQIVAGHPHVVQVIDFDETSARSAIIMEMLGPSLLRMISFPGSVAPFAVQDVAVTLLNALKHIHSFCVAHCDISARNVCSRLGLGWQMVLIDFDSAQIHQSLEELSEGRINLEHFRAQDISRINHFKEDVFAASCVVKAVEDLVKVAVKVVSDERKNEELRKDVFAASCVVKAVEDLVKDVFAASCVVKAVEDLVKDVFAASCVVKAVEDLVEDRLGTFLGIKSFFDGLAGTLSPAVGGFLYTRDHFLPYGLSCGLCAVTAGVFASFAPLQEKPVSKEEVEPMLSKELESDSEAEDEDTGRFLAENLPFSKSSMMVKLMTNELGIMMDEQLKTALYDKFGVQGTEARKKHVSRSNTIGVDNFAASQQSVPARRLRASCTQPEFPEEMSPKTSKSEDEWQDDWDRGKRGPFFLAKDTLQDMKKSCEWGGRFSHDIGRCGRAVGWGHIYPEYFGQVTTASSFFRHCALPRFRQDYFTYNASAQLVPEGRLPVECRVLEPHYAIVLAALSLLALVSLIQVCKTSLRSCRWQRRDQFKPSPSEVSLGSMKLQGHVPIGPKEAKLRGNHRFELLSSRIRTEEEVGWWLWCHLSAQTSILERQIQAEAAALRALRARAKYVPRPAGAEEESDEEEEEDGPDFLQHGDELGKAMVIVHKRALEGVAAWCVYVAGGLCMPSGIQKSQLKDVATNIDENVNRPLPKLFAEALLLRTMESLSEHILHCPERLAFLYFKILVASKEECGDDDNVPAHFIIDLETLQDGLDQMQFHSNPYEWARMPNGKQSLGINFDDINECGIQCREEVVKTYKEPRSLMVVVDFMICYRVPFMLKAWTLLIAVYIYLGTGFGNDITTSFNGSWFKPKWLRLNFIQYTAAADAACWVMLETITICYTCWQRWPSLCRRSPGVPGLFWILKHFVNACLSAAGCLMVWSNAKFATKPWQCRQSDANECVDPRAASFQDLWETMSYALIYWLARVLLFWLMHRRSFPMFIHGTPWHTARREGGRGRCDKAKKDCRVRMLWILMLMCSMAIEVFIILPSMKGLDLNTACGLDTFGNVTGLPFQVGECSEKESILDFGCVTCIGSVLFALALVFLGSMVDVYFVFYIFSAVFGSIMGHRRHLNDVKNISVPIDLRPGVGKDAHRFEAAFGPQWQMIWREIVQSLLDESYISVRMGKWLVEAAGIGVDGQELLNRRDKKDQPIHLSRFPAMAAERLAFFFQSLAWIQDPGGGIKFRAETDALTAGLFDPGTVPSLTQIIPAYNEVVIPTVDFLRAGALPEDAMNQSPDDQPGIGDLTAPPLGDGVNSNLAFIISQFPEEWMFLAKRLFQEGLLEQPNSHELYKSFMKKKLREDLVIEVRLWAAMRTQSVAKTVVGALQYGKALASLPKMKQYYAQFPEKRNPEDHAELILAHQTYGMKAPEGNPENDEAIRLLLTRHANDPIFLVFDLTPATLEEVWYMVEAFLTRRGGYQLGAFTYASVKCRWDSATAGLSILEVLPRKYPLRIGQGEFKTQGKACNQLNALRFASGHYIQALDCNMGTFRGEGFKVPYVLRLFMPLDKKNRVATRCRYLGFREHIYTGREGTVGKCHAAAEWTFGTIYQRFLSGMGTRMHYGHPDFVDGFWARNRGGMSKASPVVNLSEDIFAGYNVHMREEASPHVDALEFEKGREAAFNAASSFFSKISGGSVGIIRSRDNHLLCERIGILHSLSFYFTSVAFYVSNLLIDISISLYVTLFIVFTLANIDLTKLSALGSSFSSEWLLSLGIMSLFPQLFEMILEFGAVRACKEVFGGLIASTMFFIFQNKNISAAMRDGAASGVARYFFTGRPLANQHQTWKDSYISYWKSHYSPAIRLMVLYIVYNLLASQTFQGRLPMFLVVVSFISWVVTPVIFAPFPRCELIEQDLREFAGFINGRAGMSEKELPEVVERGQRGRVRTIFECGLVDAVSYWTGMPLVVLSFNLLSRLLVCVALALALPAEIIDFLWVYLVVLSVQWVLVLGFFTFGLNNILLTLSLLVWLLVLPIGRLVIGTRAVSPSLWMRLPEYFISFLVFLVFLGLVHHVLLTACRVIISMQANLCCFGLDERNHRIQRWVRLAHATWPCLSALPKRRGAKCVNMEADELSLGMTPSADIIYLVKVSSRESSWPAVENRQMFE